MIQASIVRVRLENNKVIGEERLVANEGRVRDIIELPDGSI